jgi:hypothetical protein
MDLEGDDRELIDTLSQNLPAANENFENLKNSQGTAEIQTRYLLKTNRWSSVPLASIVLK